MDRNQEGSSSSSSHRKEMGRRGIIRQRVKGSAMPHDARQQRAGVAADAVDLLFLDQVPRAKRRHTHGPLQMEMCSASDKR